MAYAKLMNMSLCACLLAVPLASAEDNDSASHKRPYFGVRFEYSALPFFHTGSGAGATEVPAASYSYTATTHTPRFTVAPTVEYRLPHRLSVFAELEFRHLLYQEDTTIQSGSIMIPDLRNTISIQQTNTINTWEVPVLARLNGFRKAGWFSRVYLTGGLDYRHFGRIRAANQYEYPDGTTGYDENPPVPSLVNQIGGAGGLGVRLPLLFKVQFCPEIRYTRWRGIAFQSPAFRSTPNQLEAGFGFSF